MTDQFTQAAHENRSNARTLTLTPGEYWHVYGVEHHTGFGTVIVGPSPYAPNMPSDSGKTPQEFTFYHSLADADAVWVATFDHEPTYEEKQALMPEECRNQEITSSTELLDDEDD